MRSKGSDQASLVYIPEEQPAIAHDMRNEMMHALVIEEKYA